MSQCAQNRTPISISIIGYLILVIEIRQRKNEKQNILFPHRIWAIVYMAYCRIHTTSTTICFIFTYKCRSIHKWNDANQYNDSNECNFANKCNITSEFHLTYEHRFCWWSSFSFTTNVDYFHSNNESSSRPNDDGRGPTAATIAISFDAIDYFAHYGQHCHASNGNDAVDGYWPIGHWFFSDYDRVDDATK